MYGLGNPSKNESQKCTSHFFQKVFAKIEIKYVIEIWPWFYYIYYAGVRAPVSPSPSKGPKLFKSGTNRFGRVQIILDRSKLQKTVQRNLIWILDHPN